jgi:hypothetical protein
VLEGSVVLLSKMQLLGGQPCLLIGCQPALPFCCEAVVHGQLRNSVALHVS